MRQVSHKDIRNKNNNIKNNNIKNKKIINKETVLLDPICINTNSEALGFVEGFLGVSLFDLYFTLMSASTAYGYLTFSHDQPAYIKAKVEKLQNIAKNVSYMAERMMVHHPQRFLTNEH